MCNVAAKKKELKKNALHLLFSVLTVFVLFFLLVNIQAYAAPSVSIDLGTGGAEDGAMGTLEVMFTIVLLSLAPSILIMMTSFTRIVIVLSFLRNAMGTQQSPPNQIIIGLALFLTLFIMQPVIEDINANAYKPYKAGDITQEEAIETGIVPIKAFMIRQVQTKDINLFLSISGTTLPEGYLEAGPEPLLDLGMEVIIPAFITSELKRAFTMGFLLFIPFLIIDMVVSSTLMSMGMVMLPPAMIALPFKIMMFVLVDGWGLLISALVTSFR